MSKCYVTAEDYAAHFAVDRLTSRERQHRAYWRRRRLGLCVGCRRQTTFWRCLRCRRRLLARRRLRGAK